jgi:hypothetical protein
MSSLLRPVLSAAIRVLMHVTWTCRYFTPSQHPDTHLPICLSAGRVSATLYIRSLDDSLSETSYVVRTRSGQQPDTFDTSFLTYARVLRGDQSDHW